MSYSISITRSAQKSLAKIDKVRRAEIADQVKALSHNPRPVGSKKLTGRDAWRIRIGDFRVIYEIHDEQL